MLKNPLPCPYCGRDASLVRVAARVRRGDRVLSVDLTRWECRHGCLAEDGTRPFRFVDEGWAVQNDAEARAAWLNEFGEEMPRPERPGRRPAENRTRTVQVLLTPSELREIDAHRGELSRSEFLRRSGMQALRRSA